MFSNYTSSYKYINHIVIMNNFIYNDIYVNHHKIFIIIEYIFFTILNYNYFENKNLSFFCICFQIYVHHL